MDIKPKTLIIVGNGDGERRSIWDAMVKRADLNNWKIIHCDGTADWEGHEVVHIWYEESGTIQNNKALARWIGQGWQDPPQTKGKPTKKPWQVEQWKRKKRVR